MKNSLKLALKSIQKKYGKQTIGNAREMGNNLNISWIHSGSYYLDWAMGGGFPSGRIIELYGPESSGKSLTCLLAVGHALSKGKSCVWLDAERSFDASHSIKFGVDIKDNNLVVSQLTSGEDVIDIACELIQESPDIIVIDSVATLIPAQDLEKPMAEQVIGTRARLMSRGLAKLNSLNKGTLIIFVNQIRTNIGAYGNPEKPTGGNSLPHYASIRLEVRATEYILKNKNKIGRVTRIRIVKSKASAPWKTAFFDYYYDGHIDKDKDLMMAAIESGKLERHGAWYHILGEKFNGKDKLLEALRDDAFRKKFVHTIRP